MKMRRLFLSALCAVVALSCQTDDVVDNAIELPSVGGGSALSLSFAKTEALETKVGLDPTAEASGMLYWTGTDEVALVNLKYDENAEGSDSSIYNMGVTATPGNTSASLTVEDMWVENTSTSGETYGGTIKAYALTPYVVNTADTLFAIDETTASQVTVTMPLTRTYTYTDSWDALGAELPFVANSIAADVTWSEGDTEASYTAGSEPQFTFSPLFRFFNFALDNVDELGDDTTISKIVATVTLSGGVKFKGSDIYTVGESGAVAVESGRDETTDSDTATITVTLTTPTALDELDEMSIPVIVGDLTAEADEGGVTATVTFYDADNDIVAGATKTSENAMAAGLGVVNTITFADTDYALNVATAEVSNLKAEAYSDGTCAIGVTWNRPTDSSIETIKVYYGVYEDGSTVNYTCKELENEEELASAELQNLEWTTTYSIYVATVNKFGTETACDPITETSPSAPAAEAVTDVKATADKDNAEIKVEWSYGTTTNITGVWIYYSTTAEFTSETDKIIVAGDADTSIADINSYTLGSNEILDANTLYYIKVVTVNVENVEIESTYDTTTDTEADNNKYTSATTAEAIAAEDTDIYYNADEVYEIRTAAGLVAFAGIVNGTYGAEGDTDIPTLSNGSNLTATTWASNAAANAVVKSSITLTDDWTPMADYAGEFDGGNGGAGDATAIAISGLSGTQGLFTSTSGATVKNVTLTAPAIAGTAANVGAIIGKATSSTVSYCIVNGGSVSTTTDVGGIIGYSINTNVDNCDNSASVLGTAAGSSAGSGTIGGIIGRVADTTDSGTFTVEYCDNSGSVADGSATGGNSANNVGGIVGSLYSTGTSTISKLMNCTNSGTVTSGGQYVGGIVGYFRNTNGTVEVRDCLNTENVTGAADVGGIVGTMLKKGVVYTSSNSGDITASTGNVGGIVGNASNTSAEAIYGDSTDAATKSYNSGDIATTSGNVGALVGYLKISLTNYVNTGAVYLNGVLQNDGTTTALTGAGSTTTVGDDCVDNYVNLSSYDLVLNDSDVYEINTAAGLVAFADLVNGNALSNDASTYNTSTSEAITFSQAAVTTANAKVMKSITLSDTWTPMAAYAGEFDGGNGLSAENATETGIAISNLTGSQGLFTALTEGAVVKNVTLTGVDIDSDSGNRIGGVVGTATGAKITYCNVSGTIDATGYLLGGIAGSVIGASTSSVVDNCVNNAVITTTTATTTISEGEVSGVGGVVGCLSGTTGYSLTISNCTNNGAINASSSISVGGILGYLRSYGTYAVEDCKNTAQVTCDAHSGGIVGYLNSLDGESYFVVEDCKNEGFISSSGNNAGGIVGYCIKGTVYDCSNSGNITSTATKNAAGIIGQMNNASVLDGDVNGSGTNSYNSGTIIGVLNVGSLVGIYTGSGTVDNYDNSGAVFTDGVLQNGTESSKFIGSGTVDTTTCVDNYVTPDAANNVDVTVDSGDLTDGTKD